MQMLRLAWRRPGRGSGSWGTRPGNLVIGKSQTDRLKAAHTSSVVVRLALRRLFDPLVHHLAGGRQQQAEPSSSGRRRHFWGQHEGRQGRQQRQLCQGGRKIPIHSTHLCAVCLHIRHLRLRLQPVAQLAHMRQQLAHRLLLRGPSRGDPVSRVAARQQYRRRSTVARPPAALSKPSKSNASFGPGPIPRGRPHL